MTQVRGIVIRSDGTEIWTPWFRQGDPAAIEALKQILSAETVPGYLVVWDTRDVEVTAEDHARTVF